MKTKQIIFSGVLAACALPQLASATNGMNMEGYGATAMGMGGASMAYDNGTAAMMNNPATLAMMEAGANLDLALGFLAPQVRSSAGGTASRSSADMFGGPAFGWVRKQNGLLFGVGMYGQGGMGTEYDGNSIFALTPGMVNRSEVSVGRVIFPVAYDVSPDLNIGGSLDYVWAGMDLRMAMDFATQMFPMMAPGGSAAGVITADAGTGGALAGQVGLIGGANAAGYFDFSNDNDFTGQAVGTGYAGKLGFTYKVNPRLTIGGTYHSKTWLGDLNAREASLSLLDKTGTVAEMKIPGSISVKNFQWPETYGLGFAYQANNHLMVAADWKRIGWGNVMKDFRMVFTPTGGGYVDATLYQKWSDQDVVMLGAAYRMTDALTLRGGLNMANNPVPDTYLNALFPATIKNHITAGFGYAIGKKSHLDLAFSYAAKVTATSGVTGITTSHEQYNGQLVYSTHY